MSGFGNPIIGALGRLIRQAIQSANFVTGLAGWRIAQDGDAEFANLTARGTLIASDPDGSYVKMTTDPTYGALVEMRPPDSAGAVIVPARLSAGLNPDSGETGIALVGPDIDGNGTSEIVMSSGLFGGELSITSSYYWLTSEDGCSWVVNGDWEIANEIAPNVFLIVFQVQVGGDLFMDGLLQVGGNADFDADVNVDGSITVSGGVNIDTANVVTQPAISIRDTSGVTYLKGQQGTASVTFAAATNFLQNVVYPIAFPVGVVPNVTLNIASGSGVTIQWAVKADTMTNTGFRIVGNITDAARAAVAWAAIPVTWVATVAV